MELLKGVGDGLKIGIHGEQETKKLRKTELK